MTYSSADISNFSIKTIVQRISGDTLIYGLGYALSRMISFLLLPLYARAMLPSEYAKIDVLFTFNSILVIIAILGIDSGIVMIFQVENKYLQRRMAMSNLVFLIIWSWLLIGSFILIAQSLTDFLLNDPKLINLTILALLLVPMQCVVGFAQNLHKWKGEPIRFALITMGTSAITVGANLWLVISQGLGAFGVLIGALLANAIFAVVGLMSVSRHLTWAFALSDIRSCLTLGMPFALAGLFQMLVPNINRTLLVDLVGLEATGLYAAGFKLVLVVMFVKNAFDMGYLPYALSIQKSPQAKTIYTMVARLYALMLMLLIMAVVLFARPLAHLVLGGGAYERAYQVVGLLLAAVWMSGLQTVFVMGMTIVRKTHHYIWIFLLAAAVSWPLNLALISMWGVRGAAAATLGIELLVTVLLYYVNQKVYYVSYEIKSILFLFGAYLILLIIVENLPTFPIYWDLSLRATLWVSVSGGTLLWSGAIKRSELRRVLNASRNLLFRPVTSNA